MGTLREPTRRERQREATYDEIVRASRELLAEGAELSLRAVAARMGVTAPALYRYVASYQELVDLVAYEIDKAATIGFRAAADELPEDDYAGRLLVSTTAFRQWALASPREFGLVFANPVADAACVRREQLTLASSGHLLTGQMRALWEHTHHPIPSLEELPAAVRESVLDPVIPAEVEGLAPAERGLVWLYMQGWTQLYGVVALEVFGHMDPRVIESGEMFVDTLRHFVPRLGLADDWPRLERLVRERLASAQ
ncbi:TetR/AcrR family transcriptional regulator [Nocardioides sp. YIM 152315]|uniref:TetR/AcrR family transcriptional regulator n=1 Tax=Nocardioides sp. YIM 152315 TaxID=3031760 RepID=UPI0023DA7B67|nr:TetR/AcrR family transcriptional regulator [Nocardioides sp. YIM 152315]MDF1605307.1 helix-turn-helix domain containing protein [Nocardioides sp. YIM 152315]